MMYYILDEMGVPQRVNMLTWARWFETFANRRVAFTEVGGAHVSTVFLGLDHSFECGPPVLFESMAFSGDLSGDLGLGRRYHTREQALRGHKEIVEELRRRQKQIDALRPA